MLFRPFPVLTILAVPILAALVALGVWQLQRTEWKAGLIADFERASAAAPVSLDQALCDGEKPLGRVVGAHKADGPALRVFGHDPAGTAGWRVFQASPGCATGSGVILVETGFEPTLPSGEAMASGARQPSGDRFILEAFPKKPLMASQNSPERNEWSWFDAPAMAAALNVPAIDTRYVLVALAGMPDYLVRTPPSGHIGYAVTWFGIAAAFVIIYLLFHARAGRLRFSSRRDQDS